MVWTAAFVPPEPPVTSRVRLVPLGPDVAEADYVAIMGSRERLRHELGWKGWPPDGFTLEDNRSDLAEHHAEFVRREAYAYSVLDLSGSVVGCVYLEPWDPGAQLAFWVVDAEVPTGLERHLLQTMADWLTMWPLSEVRVPLREANVRGVATAQAMAMKRVAGPPGHISFRLVGA
ncbi:MAG: N-acetyltransferase [Myxococcota bacterium]